MSKLLTTQYKYSTIQKKDFKLIIYSAFGFFVGRGILFTFVNPFSVAFLSLFLGTSNINFSIVYLALLFGLFQSFSGIFFYTYLTGATIMLVANFIISKSPHLKDNLTNFKRGAISSFAIFMAGLIPIFYYGFSTYFLFCFLFFALYSFVLPIILARGFSIFAFVGSIKPLTTEEIISISILFSGLILGASSIKFSYFDFNVFFVGVAVLILGYSSGSSASCTGAIALSFIPFLSKAITPYELIIFAIFGIFSGFSKNGNKYKNILGGGLGLLISYFYIDKGFFTIPAIISLVFAICLFYILPNNWYLILQSTFGQTVDNSIGYGDKIKYFTSSKLNSYSKSFLQLSKTFKSLAVSKEKLNQEDISNLINNVVNKSCENCDKKRHCWQSVFYTTYKVTTKLIENIEDGDKSKIEESRESLAHICKNHELFLDNTYTYFEFYKSGMVWQNKICENKSLIADQLFDISNIFGNIVKDLNEKISFLPKYENIIFKSLESNNISPHGVLVLKNNKDNFNIWVSLDFNMNEKDAFRIIQKCVSKAIGNNVKIISTSIQFNGKYEIYLEEAYKYRVVFGVGKLKKANTKVSGDSYSTLNLQNGETILAISDGMGSGKKASIDSSACIELFEEFIETGFDKKLAIKLINSSLILKSSEDSFTTLDACIVDLYRGVGQFMKIGAVPSYILRGTEVITITSSSLPIGILSNIDMDIMTKSLRDGDIIILVSDGVLDVIHSYDEQDKWIKSTIKGFGGKNPQDIADHIIMSASSMAKGSIGDDMSVVVGKIVKN